MAISINVVPVSTTPTLFAKIGASPYVILASIPQCSDAGSVSVIELKQLLSVQIDHGAKVTYTYAIWPGYLIGLVPPKVISP